MHIVIASFTRFLLQLNPHILNSHETGISSIYRIIRYTTLNETIVLVM